MMPAKELVGMVLRNSLRSPRHFVLSAFGIVIGIGAFVLFLALTQKAGTVIDEVFPIEEVEVVAPRISFLGQDQSKKLDDSVVATILARPEVKSAVPRMALVFPAAGRGDFEGKDLKFEMGGFADGVDPAFVVDPSTIANKDDPEQLAAHKRLVDYFKYWDEEDRNKPKVKCEPPPPDPKDDILQSPRKRPKDEAPVNTGWGTAPVDAPDPVDAPVDAPVAAGSAGSGSGSAADPKKKEPQPEYFNPCPDPDRYYCDDTEKICKHRVPIVLSATVVELYNNQFAKTHSMPMADKSLVSFLIQSKGLSAMRFSIGLGNTTIAGGSGKKTLKKPRRIEAVVIGVSPRAMRIGVTMPIQYVRKWNQEYLGDEAARLYSSIIVTLKDRTQLAPFAEWLIKKQELRLEDNLGQKFGTVIFVIRLLFLIISVAILVIAVINIGHNFFVQVTERRREIGIMRAVGASQTDVMLVILGEAAVIGIIGGVIGVGIALGIGGLWNWYAETGVDAFPHKPDSWFEFKWWIWASGLAFSTVFCILGGYLPARRAAKMEPAQALAQN